MAYMNFLSHCYIDTEVEVKEIYTNNHIWTLFEKLLIDMARVRHTLRVISSRRMYVRSSLAVKCMSGHLYVFRPDVQFFI